MRMKKMLKRAAGMVFSFLIMLGCVLLPDFANSKFVVQAAGTSFDNAKSVVINQSYTDSLSSYGEKDYYVFNLKETSKINISFAHNYIDDNWGYFWELSVYKDDNDLTKIYSHDLKGPKRSETTANIGLPKGKYYIRIESGTQYSNADYTFKINATKTDVWETEFNDSVESSNYINVNKKYYGSLRNSDDKDFYTFSLSDSSKVNLSFNHDYIDSNDYFWLATLYNDNDEKIMDWSINGKQKTYTGCNLGLPKGKYYILINKYRDTNYWSYSGIDYNFIINTVSTNTWETEFNDVFEKADQLITNKKYYGCLKTREDKDYYTFTLSDSAKISLNFNHEYIDNNDYFWLMTLYNSNEEKIMDWSINGKQKTYTSCNLGVPKGKYYILINKNRDTNYWSFSDIDYNFSVNSKSEMFWEKEINNDFSNATSINTNQLYTGNLMYADDIDIYKFTLSKSENIDLYFKHEFIDSWLTYWQVEIYDSNKVNENVASFKMKGNETVSNNSNIKLSKGNYFIKIKKGSDLGWGSSYSNTEYSIKISVKSSEIAVTKISLNKTSVSLKKGDTLKIKATVTPSNATNKTVTWTSSNTSVATVSNGTVTAKSVGTAKITAKTSNGKTASCDIKVVGNDYIVVTGLIMNKSNITLGQNETYALNAGIYPPNATNKTLTWVSSDTNTVSVSSDGKITAKKNGTAVITVRSVDGRKTTCNVTVKNAPTKVSVSKTEMTLKVGQKGSLDYILPDGCGCGKCVFRSSDSSVVKMIKTLDKATFKAVKKGTAYVIAKTYNGKEAKCKITVV